MGLQAAESLMLPHGATAVRWRRSARARRITLRIDPREGSVVVTLPPRAAVAAGRALLLDHAGWVAERLARLPLAAPFADGGVVAVDGVPVRIVHRPGACGALREGDTLVVGGDAAFLPRRVTDHLRGLARQRLAALALGKVGMKGGVAGLRIRRVTIKDTRTRWGSCAADGTLMFSWRLIMAPPFVQDYVVGHEVAHLRHMNHGPRFWALVGELTPHREAASAWLVAHGAGLMRAGLARGG